MFLNTSSDSEISAQLQSMSAAGSHDLETILIDYPDLNKLYNLVLTSIDTISKNDETSNTKMIKGGINRLLQNISAIKAPAISESSSAVLDDMNDEGKDLTDEYSSLYEIRDQLLAANRLQRRKADDEKETLSFVNDNLKSDLGEVKMELDMKNGTIKRLENQLNESTKEISNMTNEMKRMQQKIEDKNDKIKEIRRENQKLKSNVESLQIYAIKAEANHPESVETGDNEKIIEEYKEEIERLNETIKELNKISDVQAQRIVELSTVKRDIESNTANLDEKWRFEKMEKEKALKKLEETSRQLEILRTDRMNIVKENREIREKNNKDNCELKELKKVTNKVEKIIGKGRKEVSIEEIPNIVKALSKKKTDEEYVEENKSLRALIDSLLNLVDNPQAGLLFNNKPILEDEEIRNKIETRVNAVRTLIEVDTNMVGKYDKILGNEKVAEDQLENLFKRKSQDEYALAFALSSINEKLRAELSQKQKLILPLRRLMPSKYEKMDIFEAVADFYGRLEPIIQDLSITLNTVFSFNNKKQQLQDDKIELLSDYVKESTKIFKEILEIMRPEFSFCGTISDIPKFLEEFVKTLNNEIKMTRENAEQREIEFSKSINSIQTNNETVEEAINAVKQKYDNRISEIKEKLSYAEQDNASLKERIESDTGEKHQLETTVNTLNVKRDELESIIQSIKKDNIRLKELLAEKTDQATKNLQDVIASSDEHHEKELNRLKLKNAEQISSLNLQLQLKTKKLDKIKKQAKETQDILQNSIQTQRESIKTLINQNKEISQKLAKAKDSTHLEHKVKELEKKLQEEHNEKYKLILEMNNNVSERVDQNIIEKIGERLAKSGVKVPEEGWSSKNIVIEVSKVAERLRLMKLSTSTLSRTKTMSNTIDQWNKWAKQTVSCIDKTINTEEIDNDHIRTIIKDAVRVNTQKAKSIELMQSLRAQKTLLKSDLNKSSTETFSKDESGKTNIAGIVTAVLFVSIVRRKAEVSSARRILESFKK